MIPLGPFVLGGPLGGGGMGEVWSALHRDQGVPVAVKVLTRNSAREAVFLAAFRNEVRAVAGLDHPGIVMVYDYGQISEETEGLSRGRLPAGSPYLVMEMAAGGSLGAFCGRLPWPLIRDMLLGLLDALAHAHARGVIHRDLKPANVLCRGDGPGVKLSDFGIAHAVEREAVGRLDDVITGTPAYMAPEQFEGRWRDHGPWTDLYALGCVAWTLVTGVPPFGRPRPGRAMAAHLYSPLPPLRARMPIPAGFEEWLRTLLEKDPQRRYRRSADAAFALRALGDADDGDLDERTPPPMGPDPSREEDITVPLLNFVPTGGQPASLPTPRATAWSYVTSPVRRAPMPPFPPRWSDPGRNADGIHHLAGAGLGLFGLRSIPLVDREAERDRLWQALGQVRAEGRARLIALQGPAGCGKSRLAEWLAERAHEVGTASILRATHGPVPGPSDGLVPMTSRHLRCGGLSRTEVLSRVQSLLRDQGVTDAEEAAALTELLSPSQRRERPARGEGETRDRGMPAVRFESAAERHAVIYRVVERLSRERPVVLWLDDVQWGADALDFVHHLWETCLANPAPMLVVVTARDEALAEHPAEMERLVALLDHANGQRLEVGPLSPEHHAALVRRLLGLDGDLAVRVEERTAGNPLFAVQLVGDWVQRGLLVPGAHGFHLRAGARADLPDDLHQVWAERVERVLEGQPEPVAWALEVAALLGQEVDVAEWIAACANVGAEASQALVETLLGSRLARAGEEGMAVHWAFVHGMLCESLERRARDAGRAEAWHRACARMLGEKPGAGIAERRARHLARAGAPGEAVDLFLAGVRERCDAGDYYLADQLLSEREAAMEEAGLPASDERWGEGWITGGGVASLRGLYDLAGEYARRAEEAARRHGWPRIRARALLDLTGVHRSRGDLSVAWTLLLDVGELLPTLGDRELTARAHLQLGLIHRDRGEYEAAPPHYTAALLSFTELGMDREVSSVLNAFFNLHRHAGRIMEATRYAEDLLHRHQVAGNRLGVSDALTSLGELARGRGEWAEAEGYYRAALSRARAIGAGNAAFPLANLGLILLELGRYEESRAPLEEGLRMFVHQDRRPFVGAMHASLVACAAGRRDWAAWDDHFREAEQLLDETGFVDLDIGLVMQIAAHLARAAGERDRALAAYATAHAQWRAMGRVEIVAEIEAALAALSAI